LAGSGQTALLRVEAQAGAGPVLVSCKDPCMHDGITRTRLDPDTGERLVALRRRLGVSSFGLNQLVLQPGQRGRIHRHDRQEEVYLVLEGRLDLLVEGEPVELAQGELVRVPPRLRRQLVNRGPGRMVVLALGGDGEHEGRDGEAFQSWEDERGVAPQEMALPEDLGEGELRS
jgi:mannose-6-phosphate isomerase-like protein (cupin superfamily)